MMSAAKSPWRTALVTGASSGIGQALARRLAQDGVRVVLCARRAAALEELADSIRAAGGDCRVLVADVQAPDELVDRIRGADAEIGGIDLVIANAGVGRPQPARTLGWEQVRDVCATNFTGAIATLTALLPDMVARGRGHLVGMSSVAVYSPTPGGSSYRATKCGVTAFLENIRAELGDTPVRATAVHPGFVRTPMADAFDVEPPIVVSAEQAAEVIVRRLRRAPARIDFPFSVVAMLRTMGALPSALRDPMIRRIRFGPDDPALPPGKGAPPLISESKRRTDGT